MSKGSFDVRIDSAVSDAVSDPKHIDFSVPQGWIDGPIYFTCYVSALGFVVKEQEKSAGCADYYNLYTSFRAGDLMREETSISGLSCTLDDIKGWMMQNRLKMKIKTIKRNF